MMSLPAGLNESCNSRRVARAFGRAADHYDDWAAVQWQAGEELLEWSLGRFGEGPVLDLGCGSGRLSELLARQQTGSAVFALDLSLDMIQHARAHTRGVSAWLQADMHDLPFASGALSGIFSNFAMQWVRVPLQLWSELARVLKPGGTLCFTTLLPGTLGELDASWQQADGSRRINAFLDAHAVHDGLLNAGFQGEYAHRTLKAYYPNVNSLVRALRGVGANTVTRDPSTDRPRVNKKALIRMQEAYETFRDPKGLPATYEVLFGVYVRPA